MPGWSSRRAWRRASMRLQGTPSTAPAMAAELHLRMLSAFAPRDGLFDVRYRVRDGGLARIFRSTASRAIARHDRAIGKRGCVCWLCGYAVAGAARTSRQRRCSGPTATTRGVRRAARVHAGRERDRRLRRRGLRTRLLGSPTRALGVEELERCNRRLAAALGADPRCADAARVLRVPGTRNFKALPPRPVELLRTRTPATGRRRSSALCPPCPEPPARSMPRRSRSGPHPDPLLMIEPARYVRVLTGRATHAPGQDPLPLPPRRDAEPSRVPLSRARLDVLRLHEPRRETARRRHLHPRLAAVGRSRERSRVPGATCAARRDALFGVRRG